MLFCHSGHVDKCVRFSEIKDLETLQVALVASLLSRPSPNAGVDVSSSSDMTVATVDSYQASIGPIVLSVPRTRNG